MNLYKDMYTEVDTISVKAIPLHYFFALSETLLHNEEELSLFIVIALGQWEIII